MSITVEAIYEDGTLHLLKPIALEQGEHVEVSIVKREPLAESANGSANTRRAIAAWRKIAALPMESNTDGFSGADHDSVLYDE